MSTGKISARKAKEIIHDLGGLKAAAAALGVPKTTVASWQTNGIPAWRVEAVREAQRNAGQD